MCKPLDDPQCATGTPNAALLTQQQEASAIAATAANTSRRTRKVRFGVSNIVQVARIGEDENEKQSVWYNRQDFCLIRQEIGQVVEARAAKDWRCKDENFYCVRGLEFLKLDEHTPSRKERRLCFAKNVMIFQCMSKNASCSSSRKKSKGREEALAAYCARLSTEARSRARRWGVFDEEEARQVFYECHLIYQLNGKEFRMFAPTCSLQASMFQRSSCHDDEDDDDCDSVDSDDDELAIAPLYDVFSFDSLIRVISTVTTLVTS